MNDIFKELARQAEFSENDLYTQGDNFQYFAELIVRECAERLMQDDFGSVKGVMSIAGARLKEHFGLEE